MKTTDTNTTIGNAKEIGKHPLNYELTTRNRIEGTPFDVVKLDDKYFLAVGRYKISDYKDTPEKAEDEMNLHPKAWEKIVQVVQAMIESNDLDRKNKEWAEKMEALTEELENDRKKFENS